MFNKLLDPNCFDKIFLMPASSKTVLIELPAITPDPEAEGTRIILAAPNLPFVGWGIEFERVKGTEIRFLMPSLSPFRIALTTSTALPTPTPTLPSSSPTTTTARKLFF